MSVKGRPASKSKAGTKPTIEDLLAAEIGVDGSVLEHLELPSLGALKEELDVLDPKDPNYQQEVFSIISGGKNFIQLVETAVIVASLGDGPLLGKFLDHHVGRPVEKDNRSGIGTINVNFNLPGGEAPWPPPGMEYIDVQAVKPKEIEEAKPADLDEQVVVPEIRPPSSRPDSMIGRRVFHGRDQARP